MSALSEDTHDPPDTRKFVKGLNDHVDQRFSVWSPNPLRNTQLVRISVPVSPDILLCERHKLLHLMQTYLIKRGVPPEKCVMRPVSYFPVSAECVLYAIISDEQDIGKKVARQARRYGLECEKEDGDIPITPEGFFPLHLSSAS